MEIRGSIIYAAAMLGSFAIAGCGGDANAPTQDAAKQSGPAFVVLAGASVRSSTSSADSVAVQLKNSGGAGDYYLEFYGEFRSTGPTGCKVTPGTVVACPTPPQVEIGFSETVNVLAGYNEALTYAITTGVVSSVRVMTRPLNTAVYSMTSCLPVQSFGSCP